MNKYFVSKSDPMVSINLDKVDYTFQQDNGGFAIVFDQKSDPLVVSYEIGQEFTDYVSKLK